MKNKRLRSLLKWSAFILYIGALVYFVFFAEMFGRVHVPENYRYNLVPFKEIKRFLIYYDQLGKTAVLLNLLGNVAAFMPFGFFLPLVTAHRTKFFKVFLSSFALSLAIELIQLVSKVGSCDVDDLLLNTLGGIFGYWCLCVYKKLRVMCRNRKKIK